MTPDSKHPIKGDEKMYDKNNVKTTVIPIIIGAHGIIGKKLPKYLEAIPGCGNKHLIGEIKDLVILETCRIIRKTI